MGEINFSRSVTMAESRTSPLPSQAEYDPSLHAEIVGDAFWERTPEDRRLAEGVERPKLKVENIRKGLPQPSIGETARGSLRRLANYDLSAEPLN